jgi:hypothetical protein
MRSPVIYICLIIVAASCSEPDTRFIQIHPGHSGIHFNNIIVESDSVNQLDNENVYNGGGVGIGDFNNDGLPDIFLSGNQVPNKLYLNKGRFRFRDITEEAGTGGNGKWCRGVAVVDINNDGWMDIYVSATQLDNPEQRKNLLYINQGLNSRNIPVFRELAAEYGLDDDSHTTQANFFDYDNDGDLDVYLVVNEIHPRISPYLFRPVLKNGDNPSTGKLFRNDWDHSLNHPVFTDVSAEAGIQKEGYSHSAIITDINRDGWKDIYVGNDFVANDLLWINNGDGTFTDELNEYFRHTSANSMGNEIADINNDGLMDVITLDMNPEDNYRKKMMMPPISYQQYQNAERFGYNYQYVRNTLQLNRGTASANQGRPVFSEIGYFSGITATDWSWTPLVSDFDNNGFRDIIVCNGFPKDITDHDFGMYRVKAYLTSSKMHLLSQVPEIKLHNYAFRNNADLTFTDVSESWGLGTETFSNGAAYADFDGDGDLDMIINNINDKALLYRNNSREMGSAATHYLRINLAGSPHNINGHGTWAEIYYGDGKMQVWEFSPYRGYLSTHENTAHFGTGEADFIDSLVIKWPHGKMSILRNLQADQTITLNVADAQFEYSWDDTDTPAEPLFLDITEQTGIGYTHIETDFSDFNIQKLLPHKFSEYGPSLAVADIDGNGTDDLVSGGSSGNSAMLFLQQPDGMFISRPLLKDAKPADKLWDDAGILLFDADGDGDADLYIASGGYENESNSSAYSDHFYVNDGQGNFTENPGAIPVNTISKSSVKAADIDRDGDLDLFIAGRVDPWHYPKPVSSFIYRNDSENGNIRFTDITAEIAADLIDIGLVNDALFTDFDNDGWPDLVLAGEWMPLTFLRNIGGRFENVTSSTGIGDMTGWWNSLTPGDFDNDGDIDYVAGNLGLNSFYRANPAQPAGVHAADFDNDGTFDAYPSVYLPVSQYDTTYRPFPVHGRDDAIKQMISIRARFQNYKSYAISPVDEMFSEEQLKKALILEANCLESSWVRNDGNGRFTLIPLPREAQFAPVKGIIADDFDNDGNPDVLINGNDWGADVSIGRYDALSGLLLKGDGLGGFSPLSIAESGIFIPGNGRSLAKLKGAGNEYLVAAAQNRGPLKIFMLSSPDRSAMMPAIPEKTETP